VQNNSAVEENRRFPADGDASFPKPFGNKRCRRPDFFNLDLGVGEDRCRIGSLAVVDDLNYFIGGEVFR